MKDGGEVVDSVAEARRGSGGCRGAGSVVCACAAEGMKTGGGVRLSKTNLFSSMCLDGQDVEDFHPSGHCFHLFNVSLIILVTAKQFSHMQEFLTYSVNLY